MLGCLEPENIREPYASPALGGNLAFENAVSLH